MAWWRRDPTLSPVFRYAQRLLRNNDATLRTRRFSKTPEKTAQHKEDDGERPAGLSDLEWMQLKQYKRWRKRLSEDPYHTLFGASNDMLNGKGLKDWDWVSRKIPRWIHREFEIANDYWKDVNGMKDDRGRTRDSRTDRIWSSQIENEEAGKSSGKDQASDDRAQREKQESYFRQPSIKATRIDRDNSTGIISPSDTRRPRVLSQIKKDEQQIVVEHTVASAEAADKAPVQASESVQQLKRVDDVAKQTSGPVAAASEEPFTRKNDVNLREASFIDQFLADKPEPASCVTRSTQPKATWKQTTMERRSSQLSPSNSQSTPIRATEKAVEPASQAHSREPENRPPSPDLPWKSHEWKEFAIKTGPETASPLTPVVPVRYGPDLMNVHYKYGEAEYPMLSRSWRDAEPIDKDIYNEKIMRDQNNASATTTQDIETDTTEEVTESPSSQTLNIAQKTTRIINDAKKFEESLVYQTRRSTSEVLSQLPNTDEDLLSAADIRASIAAKRSNMQYQAAKKVERNQMEKAFEENQKPRADIDPMIESKTVNDQYVRRLEMLLAPSTSKAEQHKAKSAGEQVSIRTEAPAESSVDRMSSWLDHGGSSILRHFWQDPTEERVVSEKARQFFDKVISRQMKCQTAMSQVLDDLEDQHELLVAENLIERLIQDEKAFAAAKATLRNCTNERIHLFDLKTPTVTVKSLRSRFLETDRELDQAMNILSEPGNAAMNASPFFKRKLASSTKVVHKAADLTRHLIWSIQAQLEAPDVEQSAIPHYKAFANSLLAMRDTQVALARLLDRAMAVYGVVPKPEDAKPVIAEEVEEGANQITTEQKPDSTVKVDKAEIRATMAANERLANEVDAQISAMQGLSDDGYARAPKSTPKKTYNERNPLAHSLFRPFSPLFESLGKESPEDVAAKEAEEVAKQKSKDAELVADVRTAYEDVYGRITTDHVQVPLAVQKVDGETGIDAKAFVMIDEEKTEMPPVESTSEVSPTTTATEAASTGIEQPYIASEQTASIEPVQELNDTVIPVSEPASRSRTSPTEPILPQVHYTILIQDPQTSTLSQTTSSEPLLSDLPPAIPLHQALTTLDTPSKYISFLTSDQEIVAVKKDLLILRRVTSSISNTSPSFESVPPQPTQAGSESPDSSHKINPVDGTARLSPTGYVPPVESAEQLEKVFSAPARSTPSGSFVAAEHESLNAETCGDGWSKLGHQRGMHRDRGNDRGNGRERFKGREKENGKERRRGVGVGSVVKTAIWGAVVCYVVGVIGEISNGS